MTIRVKQLEWLERRRFLEAADESIGCCDDIAFSIRAMKGGEG